MLFSFKLTQITIKNDLPESTDADIVTHEGDHIYRKYKGAIGSRDLFKYPDRVSDAEVDAVNTNNILRYAQNRTLLNRYGTRIIAEKRLTNPETYNPYK